MVESKKNIQETLKKQRKRMIIAAIVVFLIVFWYISTSYDKPTSIVVVQAFLHAVGVLLVYYFLIAEKPLRWSKGIFKFIVMLGTAGWLTVGMLSFLFRLGQRDLITKEHCYLVIAILAVTFIIGLYVGKLLLKKTKLRWWVEVSPSMFDGVFDIS